MRGFDFFNALSRTALLLWATCLAACVAASGGVDHTRIAALAHVARSYAPEGQARVEHGMDPAMLALARRLEPGRRADLWGRMRGWSSLDVSTPPSLGFVNLTPEQAMRINGFLPSAGEPPPPAMPFFLRAGAAERERALFCLTQAIYYEAALEPVQGQEAVAQTVLNRVRHPAFPKSVCGVVYQGSQQVTGCQFSFTCDGSRSRAPMAAIWEKCKAVAERALSGFVQPAVGTATYYHADYVFPRWGPTMVKIAQIGAHIFYRFPGPAGRTASFTGRYGGGELQVSMAGPSPEALAAAKAAAEAGQVTPEAFAIIDPTSPNGLRNRVAGEVVFGRRVPTKDEIAKINASLAAAFNTPKGPAAQASLLTPPPPAVAKPGVAARPAGAAPAKPEAPASAAPAFSGDLPIGKP